MEESLAQKMKSYCRIVGYLPETAEWEELRSHLEELDGVEVTDFVTKQPADARIGFTYIHSRFLVSRQLGDYWFFVDNPCCPGRVLDELMSHCALLLGERKSPSMSHLSGGAI